MSSAGPALLLDAASELSRIDQTQFRSLSTVRAVLKSRRLLMLSTLEARRLRSDEPVGDSISNDFFNVANWPNDTNLRI
jgi:hypothetical protein